MKAKDFLLGFTFGSIAGAVAGILTARKPGEEVRAEIGQIADNSVRKVKQASKQVQGKAIEVAVDVENGVGTVLGKVKEIKNDLNRKTSGMRSSLISTAEIVGDKALQIRDALSNITPDETASAESKDDKGIKKAS